MSSVRSHRRAVEKSPGNLNYIFELGLALQRVGQYGMPRRSSVTS